MNRRFLFVKYSILVYNYYTSVSDGITQKNERATRSFFGEKYGRKKERRFDKQNPYGFGKI